jgi:hypothetical protein
MAMGQLNKTQLETIKLSKEILLLDQQIKNARSQDIYSILYTSFPQIITILGGIGIAAATAYFTYWRDKRIPPKTEQEKILIDRIKEWYSRNHLDAYYKIWEDVENIEESRNFEKIINNYWQNLSKKKFPPEYLPLKDENLFNEIKNLSNRLHFNYKREEIHSMVNSIKNSADVEFYSGVRIVLPTIIDMAIMATIYPDYKLSEIDKENYETLVKSSLNKLKIMMIFYRIRENKQICEILIRAKLNEKILNSTNLCPSDMQPQGEI